MTAEYGLFSDEGLVEGGFFSPEEANLALERYSAEDGLEVEEVCPEHPEQPRRWCEECDSEETDEEEEEEGDE